jgi:hypothetical protein
VLDSDLEVNHNQFESTVPITAMLGGALVTTTWRILGLWTEERPPAMEVNCEYIKKAAADKRQGVVFQLGGST